MNKTLIATGSILLALLTVLPAAGYHVTSAPAAFSENVSPSTTTIGVVTAGDFVLPASPLVLCESTGQADPVNTGLASVEDPANPGMYLTSLEGQPGVAGLCYTGRNGASGTLPGNTAVYTQLDLCTYAILDPLHAGTCNGATGLKLWAFQARLGVYDCFASVGESFVYDERYAAMTWDAPATGANGHVTVFPDVFTSLLPDVDPVTLAVTPSPLLTHATTVPNPAALLVGSAFTTAVTAAPTSGACGGAASTGPVWIV